MKLSKKQWAFYGVGIAGVCAALVSIPMYSDNQIPLVCEQLNPRVKYARQCDAQDLTRIRKAHAKVALEVNPVLAEPTAAALASFVADQGRLKRTIVLDRLNSGDINAACEDLARWNKTKGRIDEDKTIRRERERDLCLTRG